MRRLLLAAAALAVAATSFPISADAQSRRGQGQQDEGQSASERRKKDEEWGNKQAPLPALRNSGPCPFVKTLYDAARYIDFKDGREAAANVGFTGEIQQISAGCQYQDDQPIRVTMDILFELGKGPRAEGSSHTYRYWVAITDRNREVIHKETFDLPVTFESGKDRAYVTESIGEIVIPRATATTSGANFEVLVGFEVTPQMAAFNRDGKRFRLTAGTAAQNQ